ncbi:MAG: hypothetical protein LBU86_05450 [Oscillospiraceae bacterium]|jgi:flagellin-like hook-associated protein FlgL|nr:hypothetical protein [Oscillospiraceae bacterium]
MTLYDKKAKLNMAEDIRRQIGEVDASIERLRVRREEIEAARAALAELEAVLRRMGMLAREAAKPGNRRPGLTEEYGQCRERVKRLMESAKVDGLNVLSEDLSEGGRLDLLLREPG